MRSPSGWLPLLLVVTPLVARGQEPDLALDALAQGLSRQGGLDLLVDPALASERVRASVAAACSEVPVAERASRLAARLRCHLEPLPGGVQLLTRAERLDLVADRGEDAGPHLRALAARPELRLVLQPGLAAPLREPLALRRVDPAAALAALCRAAGLEQTRFGRVSAVRQGAAGAAGAADPAPVASCDLSGPRVSLDVTDLDLADACEQVGRLVGRNVLVDPNVQARVTVCLSDVPWRAAVEALARLGRAEVEERPGGILILTRGPGLACHARQAPLGPLCRLLARAAGCGLILGQGVAGRVTLDAWEAEPLSLLLALLHAAGLEAQVAESERLITVVPAGRRWADPARLAVELALEEVGRAARVRDMSALTAGLQVLQARAVGAGPLARSATDGAPLTIEALLEVRLDEDWRYRPAALVNGQLLHRFSGFRAVRSDLGPYRLLEVGPEGEARFRGPGPEVLVVSLPAPPPPAPWSPPAVPDLPPFEAPPAKPLPEAPLPEAPLPEEPPPLEPLPELPPIEPLPPLPMDDPGPGQVNVEADDLDLREVVAAIGADAGVELQVSPRIRERVTVSLRAIPWREAVEVLARMTRCQLEELPGGGLRVIQVASVGLAAEDAPAGALASLLARQAGRRGFVAPSCEVAGRLSLEVEELEWDTLLGGLARGAGLELLFPPGPRDERRVAFLSPAPLPAELLAGDPGGATVQVYLGGAPVDQILPLLAEAGGLRVELAPEVQGELWGEADQVSAREALLGLTLESGLTLAPLGEGGQGARVSGHPLVRRGPGGGDPRVEQALVELAAASAERIPGPLSAAGERLRRAVLGHSLDPERDAAERVELQVQAEEMLHDLLYLGKDRQVEHLVVVLSRMREFLTRSGLRGIRVVRGELERQRERLRGLPELLLSLELQLDIQEGTTHLQAMEEAIQGGRHAQALERFAQLEALVARMTAEEPQVFHRNAEALFLRGKSLCERARALDGWKLPGPLCATLGLGEERLALFPGRRVRPGDELDDGIRVIEVGHGWVRLRREGWEQLVEVRRP